MGVHSTLCVSRPAALAFVEARLRSSPDDDLERVLDALLGKHLYNALISNAGQDDHVLEFLSDA